MACLWETYLLLCLKNFFNFICYQATQILFKNPEYRFEHLQSNDAIHVFIILHIDLQFQHVRSQTWHLPA